MKKNLHMSKHKFMEFFLPMIPPTITAQQHKVTVENGKPRFYDPPKLANAKVKLKAHLAKYTPQAPYDVAVRLYTKWLFPISGKHFDGEYKPTKPDTDNLQKMLKDCMTDCKFWKDDAIVASEVVEKFYAELPGIYIGIEVLENEQERNCG